MSAVGPEPATWPVGLAELDPVQVAYLAGGAAGALAAAVVSLASRGLLLAQPPRGLRAARFIALGALPDDAHPVERAVHAAAGGSRAMVLLARVHDWRVRGFHARVAAGRLSGRQLVRGRRLVARGPRAPLAAGATPADLRRAADGPLAGVADELVQAGLASGGWTATPTAAGHGVLAELRRRHAGLRHADGANGQMVLAVALWGTGELIGTRLDGVREALRPDLTIAS